MARCILQAGPASMNPTHITVMSSMYLYAIIKLEHSADLGSPGEVQRNHVSVYVSTMQSCVCVHVRNKKAPKTFEWLFKLHHYYCFS